MSAPSPVTLDLVREALATSERPPCRSGSCTAHPCQRPSDWCGTAVEDSIVTVVTVCDHHWRIYAWAPVWRWEAL